MAKVFVHDQTSKIDAPNQANAKLTVYCLSGSTVHAVSSTEVRTIIADKNGKAVFTGLYQGRWNITAQNGNSTATQNVDIVTDYEITMKYFEATLNITYPSESVCTCSDGITTFTAPDNSGNWVCKIPGTGSWVVRCSNRTQSKEQTVVVSYDGQIVNVKVAYFDAAINVNYPYGAICTCSDEESILSAPNTSGNWSFSIPNVGVWTITATDGVQTITKTVNITSNGQVESVFITFFSSTINVTYPSGATCTCSDGITTLVAPNTSGIWTVTVPRLGTWIVKAYDNDNSTTTTVTITADGQKVNVKCEFFISYINVVYPVGAFKVVLWYLDSVLGKVEMLTDTSSSGFVQFVVRKAGNYQVGAYRVSPYADIEYVIGDYASESTIISASGDTSTISLNFNTIPEFTYSGTHRIVDDAGELITQTNGNWNIMFLTSGIFNITKSNGAKNGIDVFCVGGGGNGGNALSTSTGGYVFSVGGGGGGGGYRSNAYNITISEGENYEIVIGGAGGYSSAFGSNASAGSNGGDGLDCDSGNGGEGGIGGSNGSMGGVNEISPIAGEDGSYPFDNTSGVRYGPGGAGGFAYNGETEKQGDPAQGGKDGGGASNTSASANSGGGGGGASYKSSGAVSAGNGGSGIVIIRNSR